MMPLTAIATGRIADAMEQYETSYQHGNRPLIEDFLRGTVEFEKSMILCHLLQLEFEYLSKSGENPSAECYFERFPLHISIVQYALETFESSSITSDGTSRTSLTRDSKSQSSQTSRDAAAASQKWMFGEYEILEEIGRGGMGVVYKARQKTPDRIVALKTIHAEVLIGANRNSALTRFENEVNCVASLPGTLPIYNVGQIDGQPYFTMQYVNGTTLQDLVHKNGRLDPIVAAEYTRTVATTIARCHQGGLYHRDVKPSNVIFDDLGDRKIPYLIDFGLAAFSETQGALTESGSLLGTAAYMAPEQAKGKAVPQSDIYSLGATLYFAITGRPPFEGTRQDVLHQLYEKDPISPRELNPNVDKDIETICLKCLEKSPSARYENANALADDLTFFAEGLPILARRAGVIGRTIKFAKRRPLVTAMAALAITSTTIGLIASRHQYNNTMTALKQSASNLKQAIDAIDFVGHEVGSVELAQIPRMQALQRRVLEKTVEFNEGLVANNLDHGPTAYDAGLAHLRIADLHTGLGDLAAAERDVRRALELFRQLENDEGSRNSRTAANRAECGLASILIETGQFDEANKVLERLRFEISHLPFNLESEDIEFRSRVLTIEGRKCLAEERYHDAATYFEQSLADLARLAHDDPANTLSQRHLADAYGRLAISFARSGNFEGAEQNYKSALDVLSSLEDEVALGTVQRNLALLYRKTGRFDDAQKVYKSAVELLRNQVQVYPDSIRFRSDLAEALHGWSLCLGGSLDNRQDALALLTEAIALQSAISELSPESKNIGTALRNQLYALCALYVDLGDHAKASETVPRFLDLASEAIDRVNAVKVLIACRDLAKEDVALTIDDRSSRVKQYEVYAIEILALAKRDKVISAEFLETDVGISPLREVEAFRALVEEVEDVSTEVRRVQNEVP